LFLRLADLPNFALDRLSRYEAAPLARLAERCRGPRRFRNVHAGANKEEPQAVQVVGSLINFAYVAGLQAT